MEKLSRGTYMILRERLSGEADGIFSALSPEEGKLSFIAKGIRKGQSRRRPVLQVGHVVRLELVQGRGLPIATGATLEERLVPAEADYAHLSVMMYLLELADRLLLEGEEARETWSLLLGLLRLGAKLPPLIWLFYSEDALLRALGYGLAIDGEMASLSQGGLFYEREEGFAAAGTGLYLDCGCLSFLRAMEALAPERLAVLRLDGGRARTMALYFGQRLETVLGYALPARILALKAIDPSL